MVVVASATQLSHLLFFPFLRLCRLLSRTLFPLNARRSLALPSSLFNIISNYSVVYVYFVYYSYQSMARP